jgi:hypothetical protein
MGMHRPEGIFIAGGGGIRQGVVLDEPLTLLDIAPLLLHTLDVPIPSDLQGRVPTEALDSAWLAAHPVRVGAPTEPMQPLPAPVQEMDESEGEQEVLDRLRALGYVE